MKRILLMVLKLLGHVPAWFWRICSFAKDTEEQRYSIEEKYNYIREIAIKANKAGRVTIVSSGEENLPEEDGYILYPNHQGMFDVLAFLETMKRPFFSGVQTGSEGYYSVKADQRGTSLYSYG